MDNPHIAIVNASHVVHDSEIEQYVEAIQDQINEDFAPIWGYGATLSFHRLGDKLDADVWPIYVNKHSSDLTALGWHDDNGNLIYGRVFAQDCLDDHVSVSVDLSHEILEIIGDPDIKQTETLPDGRIAAREMCDPVEDDIYGYMKNRVLVSNFVLPSYFRPNTPPNVLKWDFTGVLGGPCPTLMSGGYQSMYVNGQWTQIMARNSRGEFSRRAMRHGRNYRRIMGRTAR